MADAGRDLRAVLLDLHPAAAAVAELAPREVAVDVVRGELEAGWESLDDRGQTGAVRLAGGCEAQRHVGTETLLAVLRSAG